MNSWGFPLLLLPDVHPCRAPALSLTIQHWRPQVPCLGLAPAPWGLPSGGGGHGRVHRAWHASCESPAFSPAPPPLYPSRSAASQQRLPCRCSGSGSLSWRDRNHL